MFIEYSYFRKKNPPFYSKMTDKTFLFLLCFTLCFPDTYINDTCFLKTIECIIPLYCNYFTQAAGFLLLLYPLPTLVCKKYV